jgi:SPP1 family predicted phage head-tail adaptor
MRTGERNSLVTIQRKSVTRDSDYGSEVVTWVQHAKAWAKVYDAGAMEYVTGGAVRTSVRTIGVETLYVDGVTSAMRVALPDGRLLQINGVLAQEPRKQLTMWCTEYSTT